MSALMRWRVGVVAAGVSCLLLGNAVAQQQTQDSATSRTGQVDRSQAQPGDPSSLHKQPYTANFRGAQSTAGQSQKLDRYLANCLLTKNRAEIEISQLAAQHAHNLQVKQYAQELVKDHQQLVQKLEQVAGMQGTSRPGASLNSAIGTDAERTTTDTTRLPGSSGASQNLTASERSADGGALHQLADIDKKITERCTQALREELQQKSGAEFDQCFLAAQIGNHMHMVAALEVIPQETQGQLRQVAEEARPTVQQHLEKAKELMKQAKTNGASSSQAERASTSTRTQ